MDLQTTFGTEAPVVGMVHLQPLPGAPGFESRAAIRERAIADARTLEAGGVDAVMVENFGDAPFYPEDVPKHVVAEMTAGTRAVVDEVDVPVGVNVLRNDAAAALSVAGAAGADFVRVNVHTGAAVTDQGLLEGRAHETVRLRERIDADVAIFADVRVKHAAPLGDRPLAAAFDDLVERGKADAVVASGPATGAPAQDDHLATVGELGDRHGVPVFAGSGVSADTVATVLGHVDGVIVGTALKAGDDPAGPVDQDQVRALVTAART